MKHLLLLVAFLALMPVSGRAQETKKPVVAAQSESASKTAKFAIVKADATKDALPAKDVANAKKLVGKPGKFVGIVVKVYTTQSNSIVILNFDKNYKNALTAILKPESYAKFPDMKSVEGKKILVSGKFVVYKEQVQIELTEPAQIKIVQE